MRVTCSMQGEKVQIRTVSVGERAEGVERGSWREIGAVGVGVETGASWSGVSSVGTVSGSGVIASVGAAGTGDGEGVRPVDVGNDGVGRVRRVRCGNASLGLLVRVVK